MECLEFGFFLTRLDELLKDENHDRHHDPQMREYKRDSDDEE